MKISPEELDRFIQYMKKARRVFLNLDEVADIIRKGEKPKHQFVVFTLDDGYKDNYYDGYPVFKAHNIPFCVYITNSFPNSTANLWWYALENLVMTNDKLRLPDGKELANKSMKMKQNNFIWLRGEVLKTHFKDPINYFSKLGEFKFDLQRERREKCITWDELVSLSAEPLATIGCHTVNHYPLSKLTDDEVRVEIETSRNELESKLGMKVKHFAFPFGSKNEANLREYRIAGSMGFDTIVTTVHGFVGVSDDPQRLDRVFLSPLRNSNLFRREIFWNVKSMATAIKNHL